MITFQTAELAEFMKQARSLFLANSREVESSFGDLDISVEAFARLESAGALLLVLAVDDGEPVGYWVGTLGPHPHYAGSIMATTDTIYVAPSHRGPRVALRLVKFAESELAKLGVRHVFMQAKANGRGGSLLEKMGYRPEETSYTKELRAA